MDNTLWASSIGVSAVTAAGIVWAGAKIVASKWLDSRFDSRLEAVKLEGQKQLEAVKLASQKQLEAGKSEVQRQLEEAKIVAQRQLEEARQEHTGYIERVKFERSNLLDRAVKLNQREFEIIPAIWNAATEAHYAVLRLISRWQEGTDLYNMTEARFEAFLTESTLKEHEKAELRSKPTSDRSSYYGELQQWQRLRDANEAVVKLNRSTAEGTIFLQPETHERIEGFADSVRAAYQNFRNAKVFGFEHQVKSEGGPVDRYRNDGERDYQALAKYLRERYWTVDEKAPEPAA